MMAVALPLNQYSSPKPAMIVKAIPKDGGLFMIQATNVRKIP
jgi:hypothetical protein